MRLWARGDEVWFLLKLPAGELRVALLDLVRSMPACGRRAVCIGTAVKEVLLLATDLPDDGRGEVSAVLFGSVVCARRSPIPSGRVGLLCCCLLAFGLGLDARFCLDILPFLDPPLLLLLPLLLATGTPTATFASSIALVEVGGASPAAS